MLLHAVLCLAVLCFPIAELAVGLLKRGAGTATIDDRGSLRLLWVVILASVALAIVLSGRGLARLPLSPAIREAVATTLLVGGLALRWMAIRTLGRFFTADVATHEGQSVITAGPYRYVRHPSYTGLLLAFLGLGVFFDDWLALVVLMAPITLALVRRVRVEEAVLIRALGPAYSAYCTRTKRLIPGVL